LIKVLKARIKKIYLYRHTLWDMAIKKLKAKYADSILGIALAVLNPLLMMLAISFVFTSILKMEMKGFPAFVLAGIFPWMFFTAALSESVSSFMEHQNILRQFNLPREIIPLSCVLSNFINFLIGWIFICPIFIFLNPKIIPVLPLLCIVLITNFLFVCGLGMVVSIANVFFRDIGQLLGVFLTFWFWITPIFYSAEMVPSGFKWVANINPVTSYVVFYRDIVFYGFCPGPSVFTAVFLWAFVSLTLGWLVLVNCESQLLRRI